MLRQPSRLIARLLLTCARASSRSTAARASVAAAAASACRGGVSLSKTTSTAAAVAAAAAALGVAHDTGGAAARVAVLFTGDRVDACDDACVRRLASTRGACDAVANRLPRGTRVLAVTPARYAAGTFAAYDEWFAAGALDARGEPRRYAPRAGKKAWRQLAALLRAACVPLATPLLLLGFSKGAVVVNQLLAEQADTQDTDDALSSTAAQELADAAARARALRAAHLLDAGTTGGGAHLTDAALLAALAPRLRAARARVHLHGTPRQWRDPHRRWLAAEAAACARCVLACLCNGDA